MYWRILIDKISEPPEPSAVGKGEGEAYPKAKDEVRFRLLDDDRNHYYTGVASSDDAVFRALDWGASNAGTTIAQTRVNGKWEPLN